MQENLSNLAINGINYFPNDLNLRGFINIIKFDNHSLVQFYHRNLAYIIVIHIFISIIYIYEKKEFFILSIKNFNILFINTSNFRYFTLISNLNIYLASAHQITSVLLVFSALNLYYLKTK